jgi:Fe-Mn family superoxide dismutase
MTLMTRREAVKHTLVAAASGAALAALSDSTNARAQATAAPAPTGPFKLPPLPYAVDALEPHIDARTMEIHHDKHHAAYVAGLNRAVAEFPDAANQAVETLVGRLDSVPEQIRTAVRNHGGGHLNHSLFWAMLARNGGGEPKGEVGKAIEDQFRSFTSFKEEFTKAALGQFGSGWAWLTLDADKKLHVEATANQESPLTRRHTPLLGLDVWEHAYYLKYQNRRADYVAAFFNVVNWDFVAERYLKA